MKSKITESLSIAKEKYNSLMSSNVENFWNNPGYGVRRNHCEIFSEIIEKEFDFNEVRLIETGVSGRFGYGLFGYYLGAFVEAYGGEMHSVDLDCESCESSEKIFRENLPNLNYKTYCQDSVSFLQRPPIVPNIVHLDSYDFQLFDPYPSALHCWKEFTAIEKIMPKGSIILIDDNWMRGTFLEWFQNGERYEHITILPIIGKGTHVYQETFNGRTDFDLIGDHHVPYKMVKVYIKKRV